jgi:hypothetical protein
MQTSERERAGLKLASALLLHYGEISTDDIRAMPFFSKEIKIEPVVGFLLRNFDAEIHLRKIPSKYLQQWEKVVRLRRSDRLPR